MYKLGEDGERLIKSIESLRLESYKDVVNIWTIGWGTTDLNGASITEGMIINEPVAEALFRGKVQEFLDFIQNTVRIDLKQNQVDALCSLIYNIGKRAFLSSSLLIAINAKMIINEDLFTRWNKGHINGQLIELNGLTKRRKKEYSLFIEG